MPIWTFQLKLNRPPTEDERALLHAAGLSDCAIEADGEIEGYREAESVTAAIESVIAQVCTVRDLDARVLNFGTPEGYARLDETGGEA